MSNISPIVKQKIEFPPVKITIHKSLKKKPDGEYSMEALGWEPIELNSFEWFHGIITTWCWCPGVYQGDRRLSNCFVQSDLIALDFDESLTILQMEKILKQKDWSYVLAPTGSHQIWKDKKPPCDRYRLILFLDEKITDFKHFKQNVTHYIKMFKTDPNCKDAARFFKPSKYIHSYNLNGLKIKPIPYDEKIETKFKNINNFSISKFKQTGLLPDYIKRFLEFGEPFGDSRHYSIYVTAAFLCDCELSKDEIFTLITSSPFDRQRPKGAVIDNLEIEAEINHVFEKKGVPK
jgi:hypothetical protein